MPAPGRAFAVDLLRRSARVMHGVIPGGQRQEEGGHEEQQRKDLDEQGEHDHGASPRPPEGQQLRGRARNIERDKEQAHDAEQEDARLACLPVIQLAQPGNHGEPGRQPNTGPPPRWVQDGDWMQFDHGQLGDYRWNIRKQ